jgi:hypothetical protein
LRELVIAFGDSGYVALYQYNAERDAVYVLAFRHQREAGGSMKSDRVLSERDACVLVCEWIDEHCPPHRDSWQDLVHTNEIPPLTNLASLRANSREYSYNRSQRRWLMAQLAAGCVEETLRQSESEAELRVRVDAAFEIIERIWWASASKEAKQEWHNRHNKSESVSAEKSTNWSEEKFKINQSIHMVWKRRDPRVAFEYGLDCDQYFKCEIYYSGFELAVASYLAKPWLRHPVLDWIIADMIVSNDLCLLGEKIKQKYLPNRVDGIDIEDAYVACRGDLRKIRKVNRSGFVKYIFFQILLFILIPIAIALSVPMRGYEHFVALSSAVYGVAVGILLLIKIVRRYLSTVFGAMGRSDPRRPQFRTLDSMYVVWVYLSGPVINPVRVKEAMAISTDKGAVWNMVLWSVIDRVIQIDPAVWVVHNILDQSQPYTGNPT